MEIGDIFVGEYPAGIVEWCNEHNATIAELNSIDGVRQFQIVEATIPNNEISDIKNRLNELDLKSIRAIRSGDSEYIQKYEEEAIELRNRLKDLE